MGHQTSACFWRRSGFRHQHHSSQVFVTSQPKDAITRTITPPLKPFSPSEWSVVHVHDIEKSPVPADIKVYVEDELTEVAKTRRWESGWPPREDAVVSKANRLLIYVATVCNGGRWESSQAAFRVDFDFKSWVLPQSLIRETYLKMQHVGIVCGHRSGWSACELQYEILEE